MAILRIRFVGAFLVLPVFAAFACGCSSSPFTPGNGFVEGQSSEELGAQDEHFLGEFSIAVVDGEPVLLPVREGQVDFNGTELLSRVLHIYRYAVSVSTTGIYAHQ